MNREETVSAAEYFVLCFKENKSSAEFFLFFSSLVVEDQFFWLDTTQKRNSQACNSLEQAGSLQSNYGLLWIRINSPSELWCSYIQNQSMSYSNLCCALV